MSARKWKRLRDSRPQFSKLPQKWWRGNALWYRNEKAFYECS